MPLILRSSIPRDLTPAEVDGNFLFLKGLIDALAASNQPANKPPLVNAGVDAQINLPTNMVVLAGSTSDTDGTIAQRTWTQVSGPNTATFSSPNQDGTTVSNMIEGIYEFKLTATDNKGAQSTDNVVVTVKPNNTDGAPVWLFAMGDSQSTKGFGEPYTVQVEPSLNASQYSIFDNLAVGGDTTTKLIEERMPLYIQRWDKTKYPQGIAYLFIGVNDTLTATDSTGLIGRLQSIGLYLRSLGIKPVWLTITAWRGEFTNGAGTAADARVLAIRNEVNANMLANAVSQYGYEEVLDMTQDARIGTDTAPIINQGVYFVDDRLHLNTAGHAIIANEYVLPSIQRLTSGLPTVPAPANTATLKTGIGFKYVNGWFQKDATTERPGQAQRFSLTQAIATADAPEIMGYYEVQPLVKQHTLGLMAMSKYYGPLDDLGDGYYGLFQGWGIYFSPFNDTFQMWENGGFSGAPIPYAFGNTIRLARTKTHVIAYVNGVEKGRVAMADDGLTYLIWWNAGERVPPITYSAVSPTTNTF